MIIAGTDFDPSVGDADQRLGEITIAQACGAEHGACGRAVGAVGERAATRSRELFGHCGYPLVIGFRLIAQSSGSKNLGPSPCWMMAPNLSGRTVLGHHHPATIPRTITGLIRTTTRKARPAAKAAASVRSFEMATRDMPIAIKNNRMRPGESISQINRYVVLNKCILFEIKARRGVRTCFRKKPRKREFPRRFAPRNDNARRVFQQGF